MQWVALTLFPRNVSKGNANKIWAGSGWSDSRGGRSSSFNEHSNVRFDASVRNRVASSGNVQSEQKTDRHTGVLIVVKHRHRRRKRGLNVPRRQLIQRRIGTKRSHVLCHMFCLVNLVELCRSRWSHQIVLSFAHFSAKQHRGLKRVYSNISLQSGLPPARRADFSYG